MNWTNKRHAFSSHGYAGLYQIGGIAAVMIVLLTLIQIFFFVAWPPPGDAEGFFDLFNENTLLGLLSLDLLYIVDNTLLIVVYLGLCRALWKFSPGFTLIACILGLTGIVSYYSSAVIFELLSLSIKYANTDDPESRFQLLTIGGGMLETYKGTAFNIYYVLNALALLIFSLVMLRKTVFGKATAIWGLIAGFLMLIPTTAGNIGMVFGLASLVPWTVFALLIARSFFKLRKEPQIRETHKILSKSLD